jgi:hypothetical protein
MLINGICKKHVKEHGYLNWREKRQCKVVSVQKMKTYGGHGGSYQSRTTTALLLGKSSLFPIE